jgi:membrane protein
MTYLSAGEMASLITATVRNWQEDRAPRLGAALAFYMALSLAPTVVITLAIAGFVFSAKAAQGELVSEIQGMVGYEGAKVIQAMIKGAHRPSSGMAATVLALVTLLFSSTTVISELKDALNTIWKVPEDTTSSHVRSLFNLVRERLLCLAVVLGAGLFLLASLILHASVSAVNKHLMVATPPQALTQTADWVVSFLVVTVLFAFLFKVLPHVRLRWSDVALGAILTSLLFTAGKFLLGLYLGKAGFADAYGAAGSLMILLMWVYYSAQVLYLGAEFTRVYTLRFGSMFSATLEPIVSRPAVVMLP